MPREYKITELQAKELLEENDRCKRGDILGITLQQEIIYFKDELDDLFVKEVQITLEKSDATKVSFQGTIQKKNAKTIIFFKNDKDSYLLTLQKPEEEILGSGLLIKRKMCNTKIVILTFLNQKEKATSKEITNASKNVSTQISPYIWDLKNRGLIERIGKGEFKITSEGKKVIESFL